ncbi:hypothetical protein N9174_03130 [bacterium]|nr:hypothetical protein [bacterium]
MAKKRIAMITALVLVVFLYFLCAPVLAKPKIAVFSGQTATIQNSLPLVTSNKAREKHGIPLLTLQDKSPIRFDHLVPQRLAAPVEVLIEQFSAHPLEKDAAELYGPPDGYVDKDGVFHEQRQSPDDKPVYKATLGPEDGVYLLPYMALQANGKSWDGNGAFRFAPPEKSRQTFYPDASRLFEEIDRGIHGRGEMGVANALVEKANYDFYRVIPSGGYRKGLPEAERTDVGTGDIPPEVHGVDFVPYGPPGHGKVPNKAHFAKSVNIVNSALKSGNYVGGIWLEGSPNIEEDLYWLNLLVDTTIPIAGNAAQRVYGKLSSDGAANIVDSVKYILSKVWADEGGRDALGAVGIQDQKIFASRQFQKSDARPGGYSPTGEHGGVLGTMGIRDHSVPTIWFRPTTRFTWKSAVNLSQLPESVKGVRKVDGNLTHVEVAVKDSKGLLRAEAIPEVTSVKISVYIQESVEDNPEWEVEIFARVEKNLKDFPLAGFVAEGLAPYGYVSNSMQKALDFATLNGMPVVKVGRGNAGGIVPDLPFDLNIEGSNLTATKAQILLMAALLKFGSLPPAADPRNPTPDEIKAIRAKVRQYQEVFDTH